MAQCPQCQNDISEDFGLVECNQCGAVLFIDMDGKASVSESDSVEEPLVEQLLVDQEAELTEESVFVESDHIIENEPEEDSEQDSYFEEEDDEFEPQTEALLSSDEQEDQVNEEWAEEQSDELEEETQNQDAFEELEPMAVFEEEPSVVEPQIVVQDSNMDLTEYSKETSGSGGALRYDLYLSGIDTASIRGELQQIMSDPKFAWNAEELINKIDQGQLKLQKITPIKAAVLINKIKSTSIEYTWEQLNVHQI